MNEHDDGALHVPMLCTKILEAIESEPKRFDMDNWRDDKRGDSISAEEVLSDEDLSCGTVMCLAGWAVHCVPDKRGYQYELDHNLEVSATAMRIFAASGVPDDAMEAVYSRTDDDDTVIDCVDHIFYVDEEVVMDWLREQSAREKAEAAK